MQAILLVMIALWASGQVEATSICTEPLDLAFVIDGSTSVCEASPCSNWDFYLQFIHKFIDNLTIGLSATRVAVVKFSDTANVEWALNAYSDKADKASLLSAVDGLEYPGGERNTTGALKILLTDVFASSAEDRPDATTTAVLISNGFPTVDYDQLAEAIYNLQMADIITYVIGVTDAIPEDLAKYISSPPNQFNETYFLVDDYDLIDLVGEELQEQICSSEDE